MPRSHWALALGLLALPPLAAAPRAAAAPSVAEAAAAPGLRAWTPRLRAEYIQGEPLIVPMLAENPGEAPLLIPDLQRRPWLLRFTLKTPSGQTQVRENTPPDVDPGGDLRLGPQGRRLSLMEVPGAGTLPPGDYELTVSARGPEGELRLGHQAIKVRPARPVGGQLPDPASGGDRGAQSSLWLHAATEGYDLYLHEAAPGKPERAIIDAHLLHLKQRVEPRLSVTRGTDNSNRHALWLEGGRSLSVLHLQGTEVNGPARSLSLPWPTAELVGRPATDGVGRLHVPLWVPGPKGGGELRLLTLGLRGAPNFRRVGTFDRSPALEVQVTDGGAVYLAVQTARGVDLYTVPAEEVNDSLPPLARKIWRAAEGEQAAAVRFGLLEAQEGAPGGLALCVVVQSAAGLHPQWQGLKGQPLRSGAPSPVPEGALLLDALPDPSGAIDLLVRTEAGLQLRRGDAARPVPADLGRVWALDRQADGAPMIRRLADGGPLRVIPLR